MNNENEIMLITLIIIIRCSMVIMIRMKIVGVVRGEGTQTY